MDKFELARDIFEIVCNGLDATGYRYSKDAEKLAITINFSGEDIPMNFAMIVKPDLNVLRLLSIMPYKIVEDKRLEAALAVAHVNNRLNIGMFSLDLSDGSLIFEINQLYDETKFGEGLANSLLRIAGYFVEEYNDRFLMLSKGVLSLQDFMNK
jgi:hypothetical protein